ncbi:hypothetical protein EX30DRAFT_399101 [Ascodesmis nigricans]|uniref:Rhodopsin domain-containing protein n=1 Tax=Ascodesmis nigricans TaxID=341454 RepID=A0A4V3SHL6_9PEZI|nr:hypothetical protein EX30DRAFT_399101 [Ascodesmis nigricans]
MRNPPPEEIAKWPSPNYDDPDFQGNSIFVVCIAMISLSVILVAMRIYVRWRILHNMGLDDWLILISLLPAIGLTTSTLTGIRYGWGYHIWDNKPEWTSPSLQMSWTSQLLFVIAAVVSKLSMCWSFQRLSDSPKFSHILLISKSFILIWGIAFTFTTIFKCMPVHAYWGDVHTRSNFCVNESISLMVASVTNIVTDFWVTLLPIPILWRLRLPFRQRIILIVLMSLGLVACAAGIARVHYLEYTLFKTYDVTWEGYTIWLWTAVEIDLGIICCSIPPLRPLIRRHFPRILDTNESFGMATSFPGDSSDRDEDEERAGKITVPNPVKPHFTFDHKTPNSAASGGYHNTNNYDQKPNPMPRKEVSLSPISSPAHTTTRSSSNRFSPPPPSRHHPDDPHLSSPVPYSSLRSSAGSSYTMTPLIPHSSPALRYPASPVLSPTMTNESRRSGSVKYGGAFRGEMGWDERDGDGYGDGEGGRAGMRSYMAGRVYVPPGHRRQNHSGG